MKKTKVIELVLITGLVGAGHISIASPLKPAEVKKNFSIASFKNGYYFADDSLRGHSGSSSFMAHNAVSRGGLGASGHSHSSSS